MHRFRLALIISTALLLGTLVVHAQVESPADQYFRGYVMISEASRAEQAGDLRKALDKCQQAGAIFDKIAQANPGWQAAMVKFRQAKTADMLTAIRNKLLAAPTATSSASVPAPQTPDEIIPRPPLVNPLKEETLKGLEALKEKARRLKEMNEELIRLKKAIEFLSPKKVEPLREFDQAEDL